MENNKNKLFIFGILWMLFLSCGQRKLSPQSTISLNDTAKPKIVYVLDSSVTKFIEDSLFNAKDTSVINYCLMRYCNDDNITELVFYYKSDSDAKTKAYVKYTNRFLQIRNSYYLPIIFETDWAYANTQEYTLADYQNHLKHPFNLNYAVLQFRNRKILGYKNLYKRMQKVESKMK